MSLGLKPLVIHLEEDKLVQVPSQAHNDQDKAGNETMSKRVEYMHIRYISRDRILPIIDCKSLCYVIYDNIHRSAFII